MSNPVDPTALLRKGLNLLIVFDVVAEMRSVTAAAERLSLTQSALSHALRRLRELFDDQLFLRTPGGLILTPRAEALVVPVRELLYSAESLLQPEGFDPATDNKEVRLGLGESGLFLLGDGALDRLTETAPKLRLWIDSPGEDGDRRLLDGRLDIGAWYADHVPPSLHATELFSDTLVGVVPGNHPLAAANRPVSLDEYLQYPHLQVALPGLREDPVDAALATLDVPPSRHRVIRLGTPCVLAAFPPLTRTNLVATVPARLVAIGRRMGFDLASFPLPFETPSLTFRLLWSDRTDKDPANTWLRQMLIEAITTAHPEAAP